jgi:hypothetical protein
MIRREKVKVGDEYLVLGYMIMDTEILSYTYSQYKKGKLKTRHFADSYRPVVRWLIKYYSNYQKAPRNTIQRIFQKKKKKLGHSADLIEEYLDRLAEEFSTYQEDASYSTEFIKNEIILNFIRQREIQVALDKAQDSLDDEDPELAEEIIGKYERMQPEIEEEEMGVFKPFTVKEVKEHFIKRNKNEEVFRFIQPELNALIQPLERTWLVAISGVEKSGKSHILEEMAIQAAMFQKKKVLWLNYELNRKLVDNRLYRRISGTINKNVQKNIIYPVFDCENNQLGNCAVLDKLPNKRPLLKGVGRMDSTKKKTIQYSKYAKKWVPCTDCRYKKIRRNQRRDKKFIPAIWFENDKFKHINRTNTKRSLKDNRFLKIKNLRVKCFARGSVSFEDSYAFIMRYIEKYNWMPDIIIFDYLDILLEERPDLQTRIDIDRKWRNASRVAGELNCLVLNADQATKGGRQSYRLDQMSTSESKTKDSHLDVRIAINQTDEEMNLGLIRLSTLYHRHADFAPRRQVMVTQRLATAEPVLDAAWWPYGRDWPECYQLEKYENIEDEEIP